MRTASEWAEHWWLGQGPLSEEDECRGRLATVIAAAQAEALAEGRRQMAEEACRWVDGHMRSYDLSPDEEREVTAAVAEMRRALAQPPAGERGEGE